MSPASSKADFQGSPEPPPMAGIYWFQSEGTSTVLRLDVRVKDGALIVWWANQDQPVKNLKGLWYGPMVPMSAKP
jgi:hypothetical protein